MLERGRVRTMGVLLVILASAVPGAAQNHGHVLGPPRDGNTVTGFEALASNTSGLRNTATGYRALTSNTTGSNNTATGAQALRDNTSGSGNAAIGRDALARNTTGSRNTAVGGGALRSNTIGVSNVGVGNAALYSNTTGSYNIALGDLALELSITGDANVAAGFSALRNLVSGSNNTAVGHFAGVDLTAGSDNIYINNVGVADDSATIRIGTEGLQTSTLIGGIGGVTTGNPDAVAVVIDSAGQLGTVSSSRRLKDDIRDMGPASEGLLRLRPVTFRYRQQPAILQYGLIAEEVADVYPGLVAYDKARQPSAVRDHLLPALLLNELQRQGGRFESQRRARLARHAEVEALEIQATERSRVLEGLQAWLQEAADGAEHDTWLVPVIDANEDHRPDGRSVTNTVTGVDALGGVGERDTATGYKALQDNHDGDSNTATGFRALRDNVNGDGNTAAGRDALLAGARLKSTAVGAVALRGGADSDSVAVGAAAMTAAGASRNVAVGDLAMERNTGVRNTAVGHEALRNVLGHHNSAIGHRAGTDLTGSGISNIYVNNVGAASDTRTTRIGTEGIQTRAFIAGIRDKATSAPAVAVMIDSAGQLGTVSSSRRFKEDIRDMGEASRALLRARPVTFRYKKPFADGTTPLQYGLIAEEVAGLYPQLVVYDTSGQPAAVQYHVLPVLLLNELQRRHRELDEQQAETEAQHVRIGALEAQVTAHHRTLVTLRSRLLAPGRHAEARSEVVLAQAHEHILPGHNTATGFEALQNNTTGDNNTATGYRALRRNTTGNNNTATGSAALRDNTTGTGNTAFGRSALERNATGARNTAAGGGALQQNTIGVSNVAVGNDALNENVAGNENVAVGREALQRNVTGTGNVAVGWAALRTGADPSGSGRTVVGLNLHVEQETETDAITVDDDRIAIGSFRESPSRTFMAGIRNTTTGNADAIAVVATPDPEFSGLGTASSSRRVKDAIADMGAASEGLHRLRPVTFRYRKPFADGSTPVQYGLIAEEVADVYPELVAYDKHGQPTAVLYHVLPALILNELQRQHRRLDDQQRAIDAQRRDIEALRARLAAHDREVETLRARLRTTSMDLCGRRACS